jgi:hypothetical protein
LLLSLNRAAKLEQFSLTTKFSGNFFYQSDLFSQGVAVIKQVGDTVVINDTNLKAY